MYNLSSGVPVNKDLADNILKIKQTGKELLETFVDKVLLKKEVKFHDSIKRQNLFLFESSLNTKKITRNNITKTIEVNRNILGKLIALSAKSGKPINFPHALMHPLCTIPLSVANADGSKRTTAKSKLLDEITKNTQSNLNHQKENQPAKNSVSAFVVDLMAGIRQLTGIPETYEDFTWKSLKSIPVGYVRVSIVADTY